MRRVGLLGAPLLLIALAAVAHADEAADKQRAAGFLDEGNRLFVKKKYAEALERYEKAHDAYPSYKIQFNLAEAHRELGHLGLSLECYERFLEGARTAPSNPVRAAAEQHAAALAKKVGYLVIETRARGAAITVDRVERGTTPAKPIPVDPGSHEVELVLPGGTTKSARVAVSRGQRLPVPFADEPTVAAAGEDDTPEIVGVPPAAGAGENGGVGAGGGAAASSGASPGSAAAVGGGANGGRGSPAVAASGSPAGSAPVEGGGGSSVGAVESEEGRAAAAPLPGVERSSNAVVAAPSVEASRSEQPLYGKWWLWAVVGAVAVSAATVAIAASTGGSDFVPAGELGNSRSSEWERF